MVEENLNFFLRFFDRFPCTEIYVLGCTQKSGTTSEYLEEKHLMSEERC
jgi:hypothetical protein